VIGDYVLSTELKAMLVKEELVFNCAKSPIVVCDEQGTISQCNKMTSQVFGYPLVCVNLLVW